MTLPTHRCYYDNAPCTCGAYDVAGDCPRDPYAHEDDLVGEDVIDDAYEMLQQRNRHDDEIDRF